MTIKDIPFEQFPVPMQEAIEKTKNQCSQWGYTLALLSTTRTESTPYIDKSQTLITYRAILSYGNLISLLTYNEDNFAESEVQTDRLLWGDIIEILKHPPAGSGLDRIREVVLTSDQAWQLS